MVELRDLKDLGYTMYNLSATNKPQDGETLFATLLTITSSSSSNSIMGKLDGQGYLAHKKPPH